MSVAKGASSLERKLAGATKLVDAGDLHSAAAKLAEIAFAECQNERQKVNYDYLCLKVFNRLQWLVEGSPVVKRLPEYESLSSKHYLELALFYVLTGKLKEAQGFFKRAIAMDRRSDLLVSELAILFEQQGKRDKALPLYNDIFSNKIKRKKIDDVGARVLNRITGLRALDDVETAQVEKLSEKYAGEDLEVRLLFGLARSCAKLGDTESEIRLLTKANRIADKANESQPAAQTVEASRARVRAIRTLFDKTEPDWLPHFACSGKQPVFVLGMPRSGTTLLEQVLGAHSSIGNSGESRGMGIAFQRQLAHKALLPEDEGSSLPFLRYKTLDYADSEAIIAYYDAYQALLSTAPLVTDKELSNIDRVGIILRLYPAARFICMRRHPLDVCVSIMQQDFSQAYFSGSSIKIVQEYETYYERAEHWSGLYPDAVMMMDYETLVSDFEINARKLLEFLGLGWESDILQFYTRTNSVRTPSLSQVRAGINTNSVEKWRRYGELVKPAEQYLRSRGKIPDAQ